MRGDGALGAEMHPLPGPLEAASPVAGHDVLERLLDGRVNPASVPAGYGQVAKLLASAAAPAAPEELAGEQAVMAQYAAVMRSTPWTLVPGRTAVPSKVFTMKAAAAALVAVLSIGGVAAAAGGLLPDQASPPATGQAPATSGADVVAQGLGKATAASLSGSAEAGSAADSQAWPAVPDASGAARAGLCQAWQGGQGADNNGSRMDAVAFQALVKAAGGADKVAAYCQDMAAGASGRSPASPLSVSAPSASVSPPSSGRPEDPGPPASTGPGGPPQGGPPTTSR